MLKPIALVLVALVSMSCAAARGDDTQEHEAAIRALGQAYADAYNRHDAAAYAALWTSDTDAIILDLPQSVGRENMLREQEAFWKSSPDVRMAYIPHIVQPLIPEFPHATFETLVPARPRG